MCQKHVSIQLLISTLERNGFILEARGYSGTRQDQIKGNERYEGSSKRDNTMGKERKHGTAMDFSEIVRCFK
jgi:hypothetical protein